MRLHKNVKLDLIRGVPLFASCSRAELSEVSAVAHEIDVPAGEVLAVQGVPGRDFVVVVDGTAEVRQDERVVATIGPGEFFGEIALVRRTPRTATVVATSELHALVIDAFEFEALMGASPDLHAKVLHVLRERTDHDLGVE
jgi:CRP-like cAMP-binding protein